MKPHTPLAALALTFILQPAIADVWEVMDQGIVTKFSTGITLAVMFEADAACDEASVLVLGNPNISWIGMNVDGTDLGAAEATLVEDTIFVSLTKAGLSAIAHGNNWLMTTDQGNLPISLKGSRKALIEAYDNCMFMQTYKRIFPDAKLVEF